MTYILNQNQKNLIASHKFANILNLLTVSNDEICKRNNLELEEFSAAMAGKTKLSKVALKAIQSAIATEIKELVSFVDKPQVHHDINGYETEEELEKNKILDMKKKPHS